MNKKKLTLSLLPLCILQSLPVYSALASSQVAPEESKNSSLIVLGARPWLSELDTPAAVSVVDGQTLRNALPQVNLSEALGSVPGLQIQNRQNYAQDLQLSMRGFGSRSTFGVRGIRLYVDGIPATMPDGQGQTSNIDINSVKIIEVLRGPYSALYGNASGGVVNIESETGTQPTTLSAGTYFGSDNSWRNSVKASGATGDGSHPGDVNYMISASRFTTQGYRDHSGTQKNLGNAKLGVRVDDASTLTLMLNSVSVDANDPGGLTQSEWRQNPRQAPWGESYNTRKSLDQTQFGVRYQRQITENDLLTFTTWHGERHTTQYQSIPRAPQMQPAYPGGVIVLERKYSGIDSRWSHEGLLGSLPYSLTAGIDYETMTERRQGFENFRLYEGVPAFGEKGRQRRNEKNLMWNVDPYLQSHWQLSDKWSVDACMRYSTVSFDSTDYYITTGNGDDSGSRRYHKILPMGSVNYAVTPIWNLYLSSGRGFETPTINELSYRSVTGSVTGLNLGLKPSTSETVELGSKTRLGNGLLTVALYQTDTEDELVAADNRYGRTVFRNAGKTRRQGSEIALDQQLTENLQFKAAWTLLDATYRNRSCNDKGNSCVPAGNRLPGVAKNMAYAGLQWGADEGWHAGADVRYLSRIQANDQNSAQAPSYTLTSVNAGYRFGWGKWSLDLFSRVDNLFDKSYVGSVIVNESNGRYYEPAPGRNYGGGATLSYTFM
ncbi:MAG: Pesticin receptor [Candidatus Erwinia impunctatus]